MYKWRVALLCQVEEQKRKKNKIKRKFFGIVREYEA